MPVRDKPERRQRLLQMAAGAAFLALAVVAVLIVVNASSSGDGGDTKIEGAREVNRLLAGISQEGLLIGNFQAPVELIEFGDLQCPTCKAFSEETLPQIIEGQVKRGEVAVEFRNFAIIGSESLTAGAAALAAGEQGRGWNFVELFYRNQGDENSGYADDAFLKAVAKAAGVKNIKRWDAERKKLTYYVEKTSADAENLGFSGTPSFALQRPSSPTPKPIDAPASAQDLEEAIASLGSG
jgi:protein-disulfide isomerase